MNHPKIYKKIKHKLDTVFKNIFMYYQIKLVYRAKLGFILVFMRMYLDSY